MVIVGKSCLLLLEFHNGSHTFSTEILRQSNGSSARALPCGAVTSLCAHSHAHHQSKPRDRTQCSSSLQKSLSLSLSLSLSRITQSVIGLPKKKTFVSKNHFRRDFFSRARNKYSLARPKKRNFEVESLARGDNFSHSLSLFQLVRFSYSFE